MSFFGLHSTKKSERDALMAKESVPIMVPPASLHVHKNHKSIVWEEGSDRYYEHSTKEFMEALTAIDNGTFDPQNNSYVRKWGYKGGEPLHRMRKLPNLYFNIKKHGILEPVSIEQTGERLDGAFRSKIAMHLGIKEIKANLFAFNWEDIDDDFVKRKLNTRWLSTGKEYYEFDFGAGLKNIPEGGPVYRENAKERWEVIEPLIKGKVLDLGCNEGYLSLQCAISGHETVGYDIDCIHGANLNKLIYEYVLQQKLPVSFQEKKAQEVTQEEIKHSDTVLLLNVIYHLPKEDQVPLLKKLRGKRIIIQCNLRKAHERDAYYGSHPDDMKVLLEQAELTISAEIAWRDKPILVCQ